MATLLTNTSELTSVADAIRAKGGISNSLVYPTGFVSAINDITTGSSDRFSFDTEYRNTTMILVDGLEEDFHYWYTQTGDHSQIYPDINLTQKLGEQINPGNLIGILLTLQIQSLSSGWTGIVTCFLNQWSNSYSLQGQPTPWLVGARFTNPSFDSIMYSLNGDSSFPNIRVSTRTTDNGDYYLRFRNSFQRQFKNFSSGSAFDPTNRLMQYNITNLHNMVFIMQSYITQS